MNRFRGERAERRSRPVCPPHTRLAPSPPPPAAMGIKARRMASPALPPAAPGAGAAAMPPHRAHRALPRSPNPRPPPTRHHQGLSKLLGDRAPACRKDQAFENYFGREVAVDASMHIYQFLVRERRGWGGWGSGWWRRTRAAAAVATTPFFLPTPSGRRRPHGRPAADRRDRGGDVPPAGHVLPHGERETGVEKGRLFSRARLREPFNATLASFLHFRSACWRPA